MLPLPILNINLNACQEDWQQMTPVALGHHCAHCNRVVIDFTSSTQADLATAFQNSPDGRVCGRFRPQQLAPRPLLRQKMRRFLVALVLVCGLGLSGQEALAQVRKAHTTAPAVRKPKAQIKKAVIVDGPVVLEELEFIGGIMSPEAMEIIETTSYTSPPSIADTTLKTNAAEHAPFDGIGSILEDSKVTPYPNTAKQLAKANKPYYYVEQMPVYKDGGSEGLTQFIKQNVRWPANTGMLDAQGRVFIGFVIDKTGKISSIKVLKGLHPLLDAEALRVVNLLDGRFEPGRQNNLPVDVKYTVPITFKRD